MAYYQYGDHVHRPEEVALTITQQRDPGDRLGKLTVQHTLAGVLVASGSTLAARQADLSEKIDALKRDYVDGKTGGLRLDNGAWSSHKINDVEVLALDFPDGGGAEYATQRTYRIVLQAVEIDTETDIVSHSETISYVGEGGPRKQILEMRVGNPVVQTVSQKTPVQWSQTGQSVGYERYPTFPSCLLPMNHSPDIKRNWGSPELVDGGWHYWPIAWSYSGFSVLMEPPPTPIPR